MDLTISDLMAKEPMALLWGGPHNGLLVPVTGPYEHHFEEGTEHIVVPRGPDTWKFPIHYRVKEEK